MIGRISASRIEFAHQADRGWKIVDRQNYLLDGHPTASQLLNRFKEGSTA